MTSRAKANLYWGRRSGMVHPIQGPMFKIKKWGNGSNNTHTPGKGGRNYANPKLTRRHGWN